MKIQPRNAFVLVRVPNDKVKRSGKLYLPQGDDEYIIGEVVAVGPGLVQAAGGRPETHDLEVGQNVIVKHVIFVRDNTGRKMGSRPNGMPLAPSDQPCEDSKLILYEEIHVVGIATDLTPDPDLVLTETD